MPMLTIATDEKSATGKHRIVAIIGRPSDPTDEDDRDGCQWSYRLLIIGSGLRRTYATGGTLLTQFARAYFTVLNDQRQYGDLAQL